MKIAGVGVNPKCLPSKEVLINHALKTLKYCHKRNALELIEKEIEESGLYNRNKPKSEAASKRTRNTSSKRSNKQKKRDSNKS